LRKQERTGVKQRKAEFFSAQRTSKRGAEEEHTDSPQRKKVKFAPEVVSKPTPSVTAPPKPPRLDESTTPRIEPVKAKPAKPKKTALEKLVGRSDPTPTSLGPRSQKDKEEDAYIAYLESKLGYGGGKKKNKREDDGLDGAANFLSHSWAVPERLRQTCSTSRLPSRTRALWYADFFCCNLGADEKI
jgi:nucleolar MIF4G domain-containing protein 1